MLDVMERDRPIAQAVPRLAAAEDHAQSCNDCHFWHFGHCVHVTRYGHVGDGMCGHRKQARPVL